MTTKSLVPGRHARQMAASMIALFAAVLTGCVDQPTEPAREVLTAARPNASVVYTEPYYAIEFYEILDENGDKIYHTEADLPLDDGFFTLGIQRVGEPAYESCHVILNGNSETLICKYAGIEVFSAPGRGFPGDDYCNQKSGVIYPFAHVLTEQTCFEIGQVETANGDLLIGDKIQLVAAPTAPGNRVFKQWHVKLQGFAANPYPCDEGQASPTCTLTIDQDYPEWIFETVRLTYGPPVSYAFSGFADPVSGDIMNIAKAGKTIPLKWRLLDGSGNPITTLTSVNVTVASLTCSAGTTTDAVEEYSTGSSGLQNLGNGYYQYNWKTPASYANSCKTLHLDLGDGITRTATFQFTK